MSRPLGSTATPASSGFPATTGRSASERRDRYSMPPVSAVGTLPLAARRTDPQARTAAFDARLLTFHARAADQAHAASTPDTTWPATRAAARFFPRGYQGPPVSMPSNAFRRLNSAHPPARAGASGTSSWSPPDRVKPSLFPGRSPRQSSANAAPGRFDAYPRRADAGGPTSLHLSHSTAYVRVLLHDPSFSVRDALVAALQQLPRDRQARAVVPEPLRRLPVVVTVRAALPAG